MELTSATNVFQRHWSVRGSTIKSSSNLVLGPWPIGHKSHTGRPVKYHLNNMDKVDNNILQY